MSSLLVAPSRLIGLTSLHGKPLLRHIFVSNRPNCSPSSFTAKMSAQMVEHVVLLKVKDDTDASKVQSMISAMNGLRSLEMVLSLTAGPIHRTRSSPFKFTHLLHSRYSSQQDLELYATHPDHLAVLKEYLMKLCDDLMAVDWFARVLSGRVTHEPGSLLKVKFLKMAEGLADEKREDVLKSVPRSFERACQVSVGVNFSPERAKGFSIAGLGVFRESSLLDSMDWRLKIGDDVEALIDVEYVVPPA